jgi:hypothetical protein
VIDIAPEQIDDLLEVITHCEYHPTDSNVFLYSSSKGYFDVCDLRKNPEGENFGTRFISGDGDKDITDSPFCEIIKSMHHASFSHSNPHQIASRDYVYIKVWDVRKNDAPI